MIEARMMKTFQPNRISRNSYTLSGFYSELRSKFSVNEIKLAQYVQLQKIWCFCF